jgi:hypothetical protein
MGKTVGELVDKIRTPQVPDNYESKLSQHQVRKAQAYY